MRPLILSLGGCALLVGAAWGESGTGAGNTPQLPVGQTFRDFVFPIYQGSQLKATLSAVEAKGVTLNRAQATDVKIELYEEGKVTSTITSPLADLYIADRKMRSKNTVKIERSDMEGTSQECDFDLLGKMYVMRDKVRVVLKNFDANPMPKGMSGSSPSPEAPGAPAVLGTAPLSAPKPEMALPAEGVLDMPGAYANTNTAPSRRPSNP